jgi:CheY-like chemotaxis protein
MRGVVLVVEDDPATQELVEILLKGEGYRVELAGTVAEARQRLTEMTPDLVLMDFGLPDGDGISLTRWIKASAVTRSIVVVALTGQVRLEQRVAASDAGCAGFISKPLEPTRFLKQVEGFLPRPESH